MADAMSCVCARPCTQETYLTTVVIVLFVLHPNISESTLQMFSCQQVRCALTAPRALARRRRGLRSARERRTSTCVPI
jgi:hypothetical protein